MTVQQFEMFNPRVKPLTALAAIMRILKNKEATHEVYRINAALDGPISERNFQRFKASSFGARVLREKIDLRAALSERVRLSQLPEGTLGRVYFEFTERESLSADGFQQEMDASGETYEVAGEERQRFVYRSRHSHDLLHVLTQYGRDLIGELSLLAFSVQLSGSRGLAVLTFFGMFKAKKEYPGLPVWSCIKEGTKLGKKTTGLMGTDWESMLEWPIEKVRRELNIDVPSIYLGIQDRASALDVEYREALNVGQV